VLFTETDIGIGTNSTAAQDAIAFDARGEIIAFQWRLVLVGAYGPKYCAALYRLLLERYTQVHTSCGI
jgi:hypothetical protein